jgi:hypothetical protein
VQEKLGASTSAFPGRPYRPRDFTNRGAGATFRTGAIGRALNTGRSIA